MQGSTVALEDRENMIKRLNAGILNFLKRVRLRSVGATILGGFAGLSLTSNIIPSVLSQFGIIDSFSARWALGGYAVYSVMAWAVGGWAAQKTGSRMLGALILGFVGLVSGLLFTAFGIGTGAQALALGGGASLLYGAVGGMIIADALRETTGPADPNGSGKNSDPPKGELKTSKAKSADSIRLFRFFK